jgi:hypothetical protein
MSDFGTASYKNRSFAARRAKNYKSRLQNNQSLNRLRWLEIKNIVLRITFRLYALREGA